MQKTDIIIPVYRPDQSFLELIEKLEKQTCPIGRIILINTEQKYWDQLFYGKKVFRNYSNIQVIHISKREFDHGKTRREGVKKSDAPFFVMMTQDAMPADDMMLENLIRPLLAEEEGIAISYARQMPAQNADPVERYTRTFNYPEESCVKRKEDIEKLGIKTYFCSNVCAAYRRDLYDQSGGFIKEAIFNEDMIFAAECIEKGYAVAYAADARVLHSHHYSNKKQFQRNFDIGVSQADHPEVFESVHSESEGIQLVRRLAGYLSQNGYKKLILPMLVTSAYKWRGYKMGKNYKKLSRKQILRSTMNQEYWRRHWSK